LVIIGVLSVGGAVKTPLRAREPIRMTPATDKALGAGDAGIAFADPEVLAAWDRPSP
jgi:hypothetical protein